MNEKTPKKELPGNLNKAEIKALMDAGSTITDIGGLLAGGAGARNLPKLIKKAKKILDDRKDRKTKDAKNKMTTDKAYKLDSDKKTIVSDKGGKGNYTPEDIKKMPTISREMAKGGEVKKYMGGGSVNKNKKNMITTKGWGASRKT